jgi:hypothetical protein
MIYSEDWCFLHIPRTGGTTFKRHALELPEVQGMPEYLQPTEVKPHIWDHNPPGYFHRAIPGLSTNWITLVRNPYARYLSLYFWLKKKQPENHVPDNADHNILHQSFEDFVQADKLKRMWDFKDDLNNPWALYSKLGVCWRPYWTQCDFMRPGGHGRVRVHFGAKVRAFRLEDQLEQLKEYVGVKYTDVVLNATEHDPWHKYYTERTKQIVYNRYQEDFEYFGYEK